MPQYVTRVGNLGIMDPEPERKENFVTYTYVLQIKIYFLTERKILGLKI